MTAPRIKEATFAPKPSLGCGISLAGAVLVASIFGVPSASATPLGQAAGAGGSVVPPATEAAPPSLPSASPPQTPVPPAPQAPVKVPTAPRAPVETSPAPQAPPVKTPTVKGPGAAPNFSHLVGAPPSGSTKVSSPGVDLPSVHEIAGSTKEPAGTAMSTSREVQQTAASASNGVGTGSGNDGATRLGIGAGSVESAKAAPPRRFFAYVWPAIALGPVGKQLAKLQARWRAATSLPVADIARLLSGLTGVTGLGSAVGFSEHSAISNPPRADSTDIWVPDGGEISLLALVISCAALMALLVFTVGRELRSIYRWPL
jgi:hypothetical protein